MEYDDDYDRHLTPKQFRQSCLDLNEPQFKKNQIDRIMHILLEEKKQMPLISVERITKFLTHYNYTDQEQSGNTSILIDEDLFVYIVEKYDGLSRMSELTDNIFNRSGYISRHIYELNMRGLSMLSN